jgi:hypothetical protein
MYVPGDYEDGEVGGMNGFGRGNRSKVILIQAVEALRVARG